MNRLKYITSELGHHLPFSVFGVIAAMVIMGVLTFIANVVGSEQALSAASKEIFHIFHPFHVLFSAVATTSMFWKHDNRNLFKAILIGLVGSVAVCGISDIFFPFIGGSLMGYKMHMHICFIEEPFLVLPFATAGVLIGLLVANRMKKSTEYSHSIHIFLSSSASLLYLISFGLVNWTDAVAGVFFVTVFAVVLPCCLSDIIFPLLCTHQYCSHRKEA